MAFTIFTSLGCLLVVPCTQQPTSRIHPPTSISGSDKLVHVQYIRSQESIYVHRGVQVREAENRDCILQWLPCQNFQLTVNSLMFAGINVCVFVTKPCSWGLMFAVSLGLVSYLGT